jgi:uncharacterized protein YlxW (UPF0749 family)
MLNKNNITAKKPFYKAIEKMIRAIIIIMACLVMAGSLFFIKSNNSASSDGPTAADIVSVSEQRIQSKIDDLSTEVSSFNNIISQLQSQIKAIGNPTASPLAVTPDAISLANEVDSLKIQISELQNKLKSVNVANLSTEFDSFQSQIMELQEKLKVAETAIGNTPVTVNGLGIVFITNNIQIDVTGSTNPVSAQFALKIINTTTSVINNVDVTGLITSSQNFSNSLASGYPQLIDGAGLCNYVFFLTKGNTLHFEAFGNGKTSLSIPAGGSITLRPKISVMAEAQEQLPGMTFSIALETIIFDRVPAK